jgi:hypothetical protein
MSVEMAIGPYGELSLLGGGANELIQPAIERGSLWAPAKKCGGLPKPTVSVEENVAHLTHCDGRHAAPLGNRTVSPSRTDGSLSRTCLRQHIGERLHEIWA